MPCSPNDISLEHIDPKNHPLVCGLEVDSNEILAQGSYNYGKRNKFVPYRVKDHPPPINPGDRGEFLIGGAWVVTDFMGYWWKMEACRLIHSLSYRGGPVKDWETAIDRQETLHSCRIVVCSEDGILRKRSPCKKTCPHGEEKVNELWILTKDRKYCCRTHQNRTQNERRKLHSSQPG